MRIFAISSEPKASREIYQSQISPLRPEPEAVQGFGRNDIGASIKYNSYYLPAAGVVLAGGIGFVNDFAIVANVIIILYDVVFSRTTGNMNAAA